MQELESLTQIYQQNQHRAIEEYFKFLRFQSISTDPAYAPEMAACADWLRDYLMNMGFQVELWKTPGYPVVYASWLHAGPEKPTLLIYNHYDVQPVDPLEEWVSPPFEPVERDGAVYARGAQDNKGQCFYVLQALKMLLQRDGSLPLNIKLCIEGEEECGSAGLQAILKERAEELHADYLAIVDLGIKTPHAPTLTLGLRGITTMEVSATASTTDLHSGVHGGLAYNPIHALVAILAKLRDSDGRIAVPGFYDEMIEPDAEELKGLSLDFDAHAYETNFGIPATGGEQALPPLQRNWLRPSLEINGICGGYTGSGFKTVIPAKASAKISCRLVHGQDPQHTAECVAKFIEQNAPAGVKVSVQIHAGGGPAVRSNATSNATAAFAKALSEVYGLPCTFILEGASIPIVAQLQLTCQGEVVLLGLGLATDCIHAPNEHFTIDRLAKGALMFARGLELLSRDFPKHQSPMDML